MTARPDTTALPCSPLQLAWLHELGIEKPWLPAGSAAAPVAAAAATAAATTTATATATATATSAVTVAEVAVAVASAAAAHAAEVAVAFASAADADADAAVAPTPDVSAPRAAAPPRPAAAPIARAPRPEPLAPATPAASDLPTRAIAAAATDLDALGAAIAACQACGLCNSRHQVGVGVGVAQPAIMIVGEAPGEQEDRQGLPFVGRSGMLLDNMLTTIGASRQSNVYVTNAIKCRPPSNRNPRPEESAACHPYLLRQIELVNPRAILVLGRVAAQAVLSTDSSLQSLRGRPTSFTVAGRQIPAVVSYHPAYLLRRPTEKAAAWEDLQRVRAIAGLGN